MRLSCNISEQKVYRLFQCAIATHFQSWWFLSPVRTKLFMTLIYMSIPSHLNASLSAVILLTVQFLPPSLAIPMPALTSCSYPLFTCKSPLRFHASCTWHCTASASINTWYKDSLSTVLGNNTWSRPLYLKQCVTLSLLIRQESVWPAMVTKLAES